MMKSSPLTQLGQIVAAFTLLGSIATTVHAAENRDTKVRNDKSHVESTGNWIYNDLDRAFAEAQASGKPLLVTLRCIP